MFSTRIKFFLLVLFSAGVTSCNKPDTLFVSLPASKTNIKFENKLVEKRTFGILYYLYYYNGGGVSTGDVNNDGLADIYFTANNRNGNKLYLNKGNFEFEDVTEKAGVAGSSEWCTGSSMADVNGDGWLDIYVSAVNIEGKLQGKNELFINDKNGHFTESAAAYGLDLSAFTTQAAFFDYDRDGDLDCYILNQSHKANENIVDTINRRKFDPNAGDRLMRNELNQGAKKFTDVSAAAGIYQSSLGYGLGIAVADINNDGWDDLYIGNDFHENDYYYINNANGTFTEAGAKHFQHYSRFSMGNDIADYNNDGQLDVMTVDMLPGEEKVLKTYGSDENPDIYQFKLIRNGFQYQYSKNCLQQNNGNGTSFSETSLLSGVSATDWSWAPLFADFDNDGNKDLFITSGILKRPVDLDYIKFVSNLSLRRTLNTSDKLDDLALDKIPDGPSHPYFYKGSGTALFNDVSNAWGTGNMKGYYNGAAYADLDNDGNVDMVVNCIDAPALILKNNAPKLNHLAISLKGAGANTSGIGAKAYLFTGDKMQYQQLMLTRGFESSVEPKLHFGLGNNTSVDSILVVWPNQQFQVLKNVPAGKPLTVDQAASTGAFVYSTFFAAPSPLLEDVSAGITNNWKHKEDNFNDFNVQYIIPHAQSTRGPKIAVGDVNNDGLEDFFACGAKGQPGALMVQTKGGQFISSDSALFNNSAASEDVAALFFDANKDGFADLYVVSGGNEYPDGYPALADRLYLNDGKGRFSLSTNLPPLLFNKSCVSSADIDHDGDQDIFVGVLANAKQFGTPQTSYLLINDGKGIFTVAATNVIGLKDIGMVTSAAFADFNKDGWADLAVAGEWMPVKIFMNKNGIFTATDLAGSTGLWQTLLATDVNGDGFEDLLAGNWGLNSKLQASVAGPLKLYVKDFDKNGSVEQVMAYNRGGEEYTFLAKDELERTLPILKKAYLTYNEVAGKTVQFMFYDLFTDYKELKAETLSSSAFINNGTGNFQRSDLPLPLQYAPVFAFTSFSVKNQLAWIAGGNFFGVVPYEGRYDALTPTTFNYQAASKTFVTGTTLPEYTGEVRDMKWITTTPGQQMLIMARNNQPLTFFKTTK
ncbi:MAG: VCBS repeat-containing protein [Ferruginibacter sp.]|nr:VCBS repeat-containing protein [Ferruginibacter sp.]